jgi:hypothetical protein
MANGKQKRDLRLTSAYQTKKKKSREETKNDAKRFFIYVPSAQVRTWKRYLKVNVKRKVLPNTVNLSSGRLKKSKRP